MIYKIISYPLKSLIYCINTTNSNLWQLFKFANWHGHKLNSKRQTTEAYIVYVPVTLQYILVSKRSLCKREGHVSEIRAELRGGTRSIALLTIWFSVSITYTLGSSNFVIFFIQKHFQEITYDECFPVVKYFFTSSRDMLRTMQIYCTNFLTRPLTIGILIQQNYS